MFLEKFFTTGIPGAIVFMLKHLMEKAPDHTGNRKG